MSRLLVPTNSWPHTPPCTAPQAGVYIGTLPPCLQNLHKTAVAVVAAAAAGGGGADATTTAHEEQLLAALRQRAAALKAALEPL